MLARQSVLRPIQKLVRAPSKENSRDDLSRVTFFGTFDDEHRRSKGREEKVQDTVRRGLVLFLFLIPHNAQPLHWHT
jgi:hypothetical protein